MMSRLRLSIHGERGFSGIGFARLKWNSETSPMYNSTIIGWDRKLESTALAKAMDHPATVLRSVRAILRAKSPSRCPRMRMSPPLDIRRDKITVVDSIDLQFRKDEDPQSENETALGDWGVFIWRKRIGQVTIPNNQRTRFNRRNDTIRCNCHGINIGN